MKNRHTGRSRSGGARGFGLVKAVGVSAAVLLVAAGGLWAVTRGGPGGGEARTVRSLDLAEVVRGSFDVQTTAIGELEASNQVEIRSEVDERTEILEIVEEGTVVQKGDLLVRLNVEALQDEIDSDTLDVEQARADVIAEENALKIQLSDNESKLRAGELNVELAKLALKQWEAGEVVKARKQMQVDIEQAERQFEKAKDVYELSTSLLGEGFVSRDEWKQDEIDFINAQTSLDIARLDQKTYEEFQHPRDEKTKISDVEEAEAELERIISQNEINEAAKRSQLDTARRRLELQEEDLAEEIEQVKNATIYAPTGGLVVYASSVGRDRDRMMFGGDGPLQVGSEVRPNQNLIILPDTSSMVASVRVHESLAGRIRPGLKASIKVDAQSDESYTGTVTSVGVLAESGGWRDPNRREYTVRIAVDFDNSAGRLKPSMRAEATISLAEVKDSLMIPVQALFSEGPLRYVHVPEGSRFRRVPVQVGQLSDAYAQIVSGVEEGQKVLLREPMSGEVADQEWNEAEIQAVGLKLDDAGAPVIDREAMIKAMQERMRNGGWSGGSERGGRPGGSGGGERGGRPDGQGGPPKDATERSTRSSDAGVPDTGDAEAGTSVGGAPVETEAAPSAASSE